MDYNKLVKAIEATHSTLQQSAVKAINIHLTIRNWLVGFYIVEFEQKGEDRAAYGQKLLQNLADSLKQDSLSYRNLKLFRQFYMTYPQIGQTVSAQLNALGMMPTLGHLALGSKLQKSDIQNIEIGQLPIAQLGTEYQVPPDKLISRLSYTHIVQLLPIQDPLKRTFYEIACIKGNWSVDELKRQINSLYFERSGMSQDPEKLGRIAQDKAEHLVPADLIKSPFTFEFLGLKSKDVVYENDLEQALIDHLESFLLELGHGFCFEAKQKRITIGEEYFFIDLVFYHRILKCHVLIELKTKEVKHEHIGQLKTYINYYKKEIMLEGDNPPVGILLVTDKNNALVEYAVADSDQQLFVSKYLLELPSKEVFLNFVNQELKQL